MAANPRIEELRKRLEKEPGSRFFAQLAEELRKAGELSEAVRVSREGLARHPAYPSARMTLGRALLDAGDLAAAIDEFRVVLRGAPDNILAGRFLGECLERLGDTAGALSQYRTTLLLAPGDPALAARVGALEAGAGGGTGGRAAGTALRPPGRPGAPAGAGAPPDSGPTAVAALPRTAAAQGPGAGAPVRPPLRSPAAGAPAGRAVPPGPPEGAAAAEPSAIPLVEAAGSFELERPYEAAVAGQAAATAPIAVASVDEEFDLEPPGEPGTAPTEGAVAAAGRAVGVSPGPGGLGMPDGDAARGRTPPVGREGETDAQGAAHGAPTAAGPLATITLAELYVRQGLIAKAAEVYRVLLQRDPGNPRARQRLADLEATAAPAERPARDERVARREAVERTIRRLEALLAAARRG